MATAPAPTHWFSPAASDGPRTGHGIRESTDRLASPAVPDDIEVDVAGMQRASTGFTPFDQLPAYAKLKSHMRELREMRNRLFSPSAAQQPQKWESLRDNSERLFPELCQEGKDESKELIRKLSVEMSREAARSSDKRAAKDEYKRRLEECKADIATDRRDIKAQLAGVEEQRQHEEQRRHEEQRQRSRDATKWKKLTKDVEKGTADSLERTAMKIDDANASADVVITELHRQGEEFLKTHEDLDTLKGQLKRALMDVSRVADHIVKDKCVMVYVILFLLGICVILGWLIYDKSQGGGDG